MNITHYPLLIFVLSFTTLWLSAWIGASLVRRRRRLQDDVRSDFALILTSTLTLFGLIVGFSFSMAIGRYDQRKNYEESEANAIGTEYVRSDLLPVTDAAKVRALLRDYLDQRVLSYTSADDAKLRQVGVDTARLQAELWSAVQVPAAANPTPVVALAVSGMNDVLNSQGYTQAAYRNRIPTAAWLLMAAVAIGCNVMVGWGLQSRRDGITLLSILPLVGALAFTLIADIDSPRHGIIHVAPQNLISLTQSLPAR